MTMTAVWCTVWQQSLLPLTFLEKFLWIDYGPQAVHIIIGCSNDTPISLNRCDDWFWCPLHFYVHFSFEDICSLPNRWQCLNSRSYTAVCVVFFVVLQFRGMDEGLWYQPPDDRSVWSTSRVTTHKGMFMCLRKTVTNATGIQTYYREIWTSQNSVAVLEIVSSRQRHCLSVSGSLCFKGIMFLHNCVWAERCTGNTLHAYVAVPHLNFGPAKAWFTACAC